MSCRKNAVSSQNNGKAIYDNISAEILKASFTIISAILLKISTNHLFVNSTYPEILALGYIVPIIKGRDSRH